MRRSQAAAERSLSSDKIEIFGMVRETSIGVDIRQGEWKRCEMINKIFSQLFFFAGGDVPEGRSIGRMRTIRCLSGFTCAKIQLVPPGPRSRKEKAHLFGWACLSW